ncbi:MAG: hypothetical protein U5K79_00770 [Cyclobacteriaceae bacterium]|nr:hypothetical protein [Cyclobacteriaceae bacterium]
MLRKLHGIPAIYRAATYREGDMEEIRTKFENLIIRDNPATGTNDLAAAKLKKPGASLLDLSFSFPVTAENTDNFDAIMIDPRISLGIPAELIFLFTKQGNESATSSSVSSNGLYLLENVLLDMDKKGMEMIVRETNYKAAVLYQLIEDCPHLEPIADKKKRSKTMVGATCDRTFADKITKLGYSVEVFRQWQCSKHRYCQLYDAFQRNDGVICRQGYGFMTYSSGITIQRTIYTRMPGNAALSMLSNT